MQLLVKNYSQPVRLLWAGILMLACSGCQFTSLRSRPLVDAAAFKDNPPHSLAILPTTDVSEHPWLAQPMRKALYSALAPLAYQDREPKAVNEFLAVKAMAQNCQPDQLSEKAMADPQLADCVAYSRIERVSRLYLLLYAHNRIDLDFRLVDTRSGREIYRNRFIFYDRIAMPTYNIFGLAGSSLLSLWHLRPDQLEDTLEKGTLKLAEALPIPNLELTASGALRLMRLHVETLGRVLGLGGRITVKAEGTPLCQATFSIGRVAHEVLMIEAPLGTYTGSYTVRRGDNTPYTLVELKLKEDSGKDMLTYVANEAPFAIDTQLPPRARVARWWRANLAAGAFLEMQVNPEELANSHETPAEFFVYRKGPGDRQFKRIGVSHGEPFHDPDALEGRRYQYYVITRDAAGNTTKPWNTTCVPNQ